MKAFSKLKLSLLLLTSTALISCDSSTPLVFGGTDLNEVTESDETVIDGERFTFTVVAPAGAEPREDTIEITGNNVAVLNNTTYIYASTGLFTASLTAEAPAEQALAAAVDQIFSVDNASNNANRTLLSADGPTDVADFTAAEIAQLANSLNAAGAGVTIDPDNDTQLLATSFEVYNLLNTSTLEERVAGNVRGTYSLETTSQVITFEVVTFSDDEDNSISFFSPVTGGEISTGVVLEQGLFNLELINQFGT